MATTGFWPVKDRLKEVIDYAENPDKTIDKKYVDSDLYAALRYVRKHSVKKNPQFLLFFRRKIIQSILWCHCFCSSCIVKC